MSKKQTLDKTKVTVAVVGAIATIIVGYWQFVWKPSRVSQIHSPNGIEYMGRVLDDSTELPVSGATVMLDLPGYSPVTYTDSVGVYRFLLPIEGEDIAIRVRVEASGYKPYNRNVMLSSGTQQIEEIRLSPE